MKGAANITAAAAFLLLLGLAGGVENGSLALWPGFLMMALCLAVFGISIVRINRREQTKMDTVQKMERYVERSRVFDHGHGMTQTEWVALIAKAEGGTSNICQAVSLWMLADHLRTAKEAVQRDTARLYQERRRAQ